jgi:hypothetical protein
MPSNNDSCIIGLNGCHTLQEVQKQTIVGDTKIEQIERLCEKKTEECMDKFKDLWSVVNEIRSLLWKFTLALAALQITIQVIFKFVPIK